MTANDPTAVKTAPYAHAITEYVTGRAEVGHGKLAELKDTIVLGLDLAVDHVDAMVGHLTRAIKTYPLRSLGVTLGLGVLAGRGLRRG